MSHVFSGVRGSHCHQHSGHIGGAVQLLTSLSQTFWTYAQLGLIFIPSKIPVTMCSFLAWSQYHPVTTFSWFFHCAYVIAPNTYSFIEIALRRQVSHWPNTSIWASAWRIYPWSQGTSKRWENRELRCVGSSFPLVPIGTLAKLALGDCLKDCCSDPLSKTLTSDSCLLGGQNNAS